MQDLRKDPNRANVRPNSVFRTDRLSVVYRNTLASVHLRRHRVSVTYVKQLRYERPEEAVENSKQSNLR